MARPPSFIDELRHRRVIRVAVVYAVVGLAAVEAADLMLPRLGLPDWTVTLVLVLALLGLPVAVALAWAFQVTPEGIRRDVGRDDDGGQPGPTPSAPIPASARIAVAGAVVILALAGGAFVVFDGGGEVEAGLPMDRVVVLPFENLTGIDSLEAVGRWAADWIAQEMTGRGIARVVPTHVAVSAAAAADSAGAAGGELLARVAREAGAGVVITGAVYREGDRLSFHTTINDANSGEALRTVSPVSAPVGRPSDGFGELRERVGGVLGALLDTGFAEFTRTMSQPPSYEAYQEYVQGRLLFGRSRFDEAVQRFEAAVALDSAYTNPRVYLAYAHWNAGRRDSAVAIAYRARELDLPPYEKAWLDYFFGFALGDPDLELEAALRARRIAPGTRMDYDTGRVLWRQGRYRAAADSLAVLDGSSRELREWVPYWNILTGSYHLLGEHEAELAAARRSRTLNPDRSSPAFLEARALIGLGRPAEAVAVASRAMNDPGLRGWDPWVVSYYTARELRAHGHEAMANAVFEGGLRWIDELPVTDRVSFITRLRRAWTLFYMARHDDVAPMAAALREEDPANRSALLLDGLVAAARGETERAEAILHRLRDEDPTPYVHGDHLRHAAEVAAQLGRVEDAIDLLERALSEGHGYGDWLHEDPVFEPLRDHPRFRRMAEPKG